MTEKFDAHGREAWDERSRDYERASEPFTTSMGLALVDRLRIRPGERVIDIGCGPGALAIHLARAGADVTAIDHSDGMIGRLRHRLETAEEDLSIDARAMDGQALVFRDDQFDVAISAFGIFLFPDYESGLCEAVRVLRPRGRIGLGTWQGRFGAGPSLILHETFGELFPEREAGLPWSGVAAWGDADRLEQSMLRAGLNEIRIEPCTRTWTFTSVEEVTKPAQAMFRMLPNWAKLEDADRERLIDRVLGKLGPGLAMPSTALLATGTKAEP
jgi:SAM-dependent methyltransferase